MITIAAVNDPPTLQDFSAGSNEDILLALPLPATDVDGDTLTYVIVTPPANGTLSGTPPDLTYTPNADFYGTDSFSIKATDGYIESNTITVTLVIAAVNDAPVAQNASTGTDEDTPVGISLAATDVDGDALTYAIVTSPSNGTLLGTAPDLTYIPNADFNGSDTFTFSANDGTVDSNTATVTITVAAVNDSPIAQDNAVSTQEDTPLGITLVANDIDGDTLTYAIVTPPANGTLSGTAPDLTYTPNVNYNGSDTFTFSANDGTVDSNIATITITISQSNDPPVANDDAATMDQDTAVIIDLVANDTDADGTIDPTTVTVVSGPTNGTIQVNGDGTVTYMPEPNFYGSDSFTYTVQDDLAATSNEAFVTITVYKYPVSRLDLDLKIKEFKEGGATEEEIQEMIEQYMTRE
jgi:hypothetical protein